MATGTAGVLLAEETAGAASGGVSTGDTVRRRKETALTRRPNV